MNLLQSLLLPLALVVGLIKGDGFLGVYIEDDAGPVVTAVIPNTAAAKNDVRVGDRFLSVNGQPTSDRDEFLAAMGSLNAGDTVKLEIKRDDQKIKKTVVLGKRPEQLPEVAELVEEEKPDAEPAEEERPSIRIRGARAGGRAFLGVSVDDSDQVRVTELVDGGPAQKAGIQVGDVITGLGRETGIESGDDLREALSNMHPGQSVRVTLQRDGGEHTLRVTLGEAPRAGARDGEEVEAGPDPVPPVEASPGKAGRTVAEKGQADRSSNEELRAEVARLREEVRELKDLVKKVGRK